MPENAKQRNCKRKTKNGENKQFDKKTKRNQKIKTKNNLKNENNNLYKIISRSLKNSKTEESIDEKQKM